MQLRKDRGDFRAVSQPARSFSPDHHPRVETGCANHMHVTVHTMHKRRARRLRNNMHFVPAGGHPMRLQIRLRGESSLCCFGRVFL